MPGRTETFSLYYERFGFYARELRVSDTYLGDFRASLLITQKLSESFTHVGDIAKRDLLIEARQLVLHLTDRV